MRQVETLKRTLRATRERMMVKRVGAGLPADFEEARQFAEAIRETLAGDLSATEAQWIAKIEALRRELESSPDTVIMTDFGAGSADNIASEALARSGPAVEKRISEMCAHASKSRFWGELLFKVVRKRRPAAALELGTCLGISSAFQSAAMTLNGSGRLVTIEGSASLAKIAAANLAGLGLTNVAVATGRFEDRLAEVLQQLGRIDYAFIDGHHDEQATEVYFNQILPYCTAGAVLAFDDIDWSDGMARAWARLSRHSSVRQAVDLGRIGFCILGDPAARLG
jgi:predicted O-methyltransferase YrrM